jgi:competence protein ComEA
MLKKVFALIAAFYMSLSFAAVEVNTATAAELDSINGIGPATSRQILDERKKGVFRDWNDFIARVSGIQKIKAAGFSRQGLTVAGGSLKDAPATTKAASASVKR